ncbi:MAG: ABC transporter substrate-binding protein [Clostridiales bacterium]|jgi:peptide/nickel transport system substrate-binding protein|nr:ABC transporter substrate-binding protein [Clostridiales bacterium]
MKIKQAILALLLVLALVFSLTACNKETNEQKPSVTGTQAPTSSEPTTSAPTTSAPAEEQTLVVGYSNFSEKFSPFFASLAYDVDVYSMTQLMLLEYDREGNMLTSGIEGQTIAFNGVDHFYNGIADCIITENADGTVIYDLAIRDDIVFSDGTPMTADDIIFNMYVYSDPAYDGNSTFYALPVTGMTAYRSGMSSLWKLIFDDIAAGNDTSASEYYSAEDAANFEAAFTTAGVAFAQEIVDYCTANYIDDYAETATGFTADEVKENAGLQVAMGEFLWGYADGIGEDGLFYDAAGNAFDLAAGQYPTVEEYWAMILDTFGYDLSDSGINYESAGTDISTFIGDTLLALYPDLAVSVQTGDSAPNIEGIEKTGDYSVRVTMDSLDATAILQFNMAVAPLHYYGDTALYDYDNNMFGFNKGDLSGIKSVTTTPMGAGPYKFVSYDNGVVSFEANELYYKGMPKTKYVLFQEASDADKLTGVATGTLDISDPSISSSVVASIKDYNGGEMTGNVITTISVDNLGYGYIGMQADVMSIGDSGSEASKNMRKAFATMLSVYRDSVIDSYYGERAAVIQYPISNTSWAAPKPADEGYAIAYSVDVDGNPIYNDNMTNDEKFAAALDAAIGFLKAAGFTWDDAAGKFTAAPEGAALAYEFMIPADGAGDHPAFGIITAVSAAFETIGIDLQINDLSNSSVLWDALDAGTCAMWAAAWGASLDPDMYQIYFSENAVGHGGTDSNYYGINDKHLDELIVAARSSTDQSFRKATYKQCLDIILDWAVEIPTYQRQNVFIFSTERVNMSTVTPDITTYWTWMHDLEKLEMN